MSNVCVCLVLGMVVPGSEVCDTLVCVLGTLGCALEVCGGGKGCVCACRPFCHALFLGGFYWFSAGFAPWLRRVGRVADGSAVLVGVFGLLFWRDFGGLGQGVLGQGLSRRVLGSEIWGILSWCGGQFSNFGVLCADGVGVLVGIVRWVSVTDRMCVLLVFLFCPFWCCGLFSLRVSYLW